MGSYKEEEGKKAFNPSPVKIGLRMLFSDGGREGELETLYTRL